LSPRQDTTTAAAEEDYETKYRDFRTTKMYHKEKQAMEDAKKKQGEIVDDAGQTKQVVEVTQEEYRKQQEREQLAKLVAEKKAKQDATYLLDEWQARQPEYDRQLQEPTEELLENRILGVRFSYDCIVLAGLFFLGLVG
jgi:hypothetical protein